MKVAIYDLKGNLLHSVKNVKDASYITNISRRNIISCLHNRTRHSKIYQFKYKYGRNILLKIPSIY